MRKPGPASLVPVALLLSACFQKLADGDSEGGEAGETGGAEASGSTSATTSTSGSATADSGASASGGGEGTSSSDDDGTGGQDGGTTGGEGGAWSQCRVPSECVLASKSCCGVCGEPTIADVDAINAVHLEHHMVEVCPDPDAEPCPECPSAINASLVASCVEGTCKAIDLERVPWARSCAVQDDCVLRSATCCEPCGDADPWSLVAVHRDQLDEVAELLCDPMASCPACVPVYPPDVIAYCDDRGLCAVRLP
jgi:hypothetical protein